MSSRAPARDQGRLPASQGRTLDRLRHRLPVWVDWLARQWKRLRMLYRVLLLVRFSLLLGILGALIMLFNDQAQDVLRAMAEDFDWPVLWFLVAALLVAGLAWWSARVMFYFRFRNPASAPQVFPQLKEWLPRMLGAAALVLTALALLRVTFSYEWSFTGPAARLLLLAVVLVALAVAFVYVTTRRRTWFARWVAPRPQDLRSLRDLSWQAWVPLALAAGLGFGLMIWFAYRAVEVAPYLGTATIALLAVAGMIPVASWLVYLGNRASLPVVSLTVIWAALCTYLVDNHLVRLSAEMDSYALPEPLPQPADAGPQLEGYFARWVDGLEPAASGQIPVFIVAAEGGGVRAAYWTALVLGELQDRAQAEGIDFARHVFAISGVSGGSLGAAIFAALLANQRAGHAPRPAAACPADEGVERTSLRGRAEGVLRHDFLAPTAAVMLFSDNFQQFVPLGFLNDRAVALERAWEAAWDACEQDDWFKRPFGALWSEPAAAPLPLLFLNSTVVETGQRLIAAPVAIAEPTFSEALDGQRALGAELPLSTAVHNSARFTYVSPAGTVRRLDAPQQWLRLVDGGYFENSGAVTGAEILRGLEDAAAAPERGVSIAPVVIHISNDPETTAPDDLAERRKWLNQVVAPVKALLHVRAARGLQAREDLAARAGAHVHFRLCRNPDGDRAERERRPLPLGWALSSRARAEMRRQLGALPDAENGPIVQRNQANLDRVLAILRGAAPASDPGDPWRCPEAESAASQEAR